MDIKLKALFDIAAEIVPTAVAIAGNDKSGRLATEIIKIVRSIGGATEAEEVRAKLQTEPSRIKELEAQIAELVENEAVEEARARESQARERLAEAQSKLEDQERTQLEEIDLLKQNVKRTDAARRFAATAALKDKNWVVHVNAILSVGIVISFFVFVVLIAFVPLEAVDPETQEVNNNRDIFLVAFGALATAFATVIGFHFGSSSGSQRKTQLQRVYGTRGAVQVGAAAAKPVVSPEEEAQPATGRSAVVTVVRPDPTQATHPFEAFWLKNLSHIEYFKWEELLFKGESNVRLNLNSDPDPSLYENVVPLVNTLEQIRKELNAPVKLLSVYRNPAYNKAVGGVSGSRHMQFDAADFRVLGDNPGSSDRWFKVAKDLRDAGVFKGGIGVYKSFVHVDTRGQNRFWDRR